MKLLHSLTLLLLPFLLINCSQSSTIATQEVKDGNSLLWKIEKENQPTSYAFGTMHLINKVYYDFTPNLEQIILSCETTIMELEGEPNPFQLMALMRSETGTLETLFTPEDYQTILDFFESELNISALQFKSTFSNFKPFFLLQAITQGFFEKDAKSYDLEIMSLLKKHKKEIIGLETIQEQLSFFDHIPNEEMTHFILESIASYHTDKADFVQFQELYRDQDIETLMPLLKEQSPELMKYEDIFLTNRNKNWLPKLTTQLQEKSCFIAVGAAHLFGEDGILQLLNKAGYKITAIKK